eukprot:gene33470-40496_t
MAESWDSSLIADCENLCQNDSNIDSDVDFSPSSEMFSLKAAHSSAFTSPGPVRPLKDDSFAVLDQSGEAIDLTSPLAAPAKAAVDVDFTSPSSSVPAAPSDSSSAERLRRQREEEEASERLAWELMQQEQAALYEMQLQYIRTQAEAGGMNQEDLQALQQILNEGGRGQEEAEEDGEQEEEDEEEGEEEEEEEEWDYDRLLALGQALGDVKTERWRLSSQKVIDSLPTALYSAVRKPVTPNKAPAPQSATSLCTTPLPPQAPTREEEDEHVAKKPCVYEADRCAVCMDFFADSEEVRLLPCKHFFHLQCAAGWVRDHNSCPQCTRPIIKSPGK